MHLKEVYFQIHSSNELPEMLKDSSQARDQHPIKLKSGYEYFIEVTPFGQSVTEEFKRLSYEERKCSLTDELPLFSALKIYRKQNCIYECKVNYAIKQCDCIPWDFPLNVSESVTECDIFGRTCFFNAIKKFTTYETSICPQCDDVCEFTQYHKEPFTNYPCRYY